MKNMTEFKVNKNNLIEHLINKMLEKHKVDFNFVLKNPEIEGQDWFMYYTFTEEEAEEFKKWAILVIKKALKCRKKIAEKEFSWFNLAYGLKIEESVNKSSKRI